MTADSVECYNCGRANPAWAQVCRSCGVPMRPGMTAAARSGPIPRDRDSLISMAVAVGAIIAAIIVGTALSRIIPEAPAVADASATTSPSASVAAVPSSVASHAPRQQGAAPTPELVGQIRFGTATTDAEGVTGRTTTFSGGQTFCHAIRMREAFGVSQLSEEVLRIEDDGSLTVVQERADGGVPVDPAATTAAFCAGVPTDVLMDGWGTGRFVLRVYRGADEPERIAEGRFRLTG